MLPTSGPHAATVRAMRWCVIILLLQLHTQGSHATSYSLSSHMYDHHGLHADIINDDYYQLNAGTPSVCHATTAMVIRHSGDHFAAGQSNANSKPPLRSITAQVMINHPLSAAAANEHHDHTSCSSNASGDHHHHLATTCSISSKTPTCHKHQGINGIDTMHSRQSLDICFNTNKCNLQKLCLLHKTRNSLASNM